MKKNEFNDLAVLVLNFNRPHLTRNVIKVLSEIQPLTILFTVDGPRNEDDIRYVEECKNAIELIDWECNVFTKFTEKNWGAGEWPRISIDWAFEKVDKIMILEDDVVIHKDFYFLANKIISEFDRYPDIFAVSAFNLKSNTNPKNTDKLFKTKYFSGWGWATTRDKWQQYDHERYKTSTFTKLLKINNYNLLTTFYYHFNNLKNVNSEIQAWDFQVNNLLIEKDMYVIKSFFNLATNVGYGEKSTHTKILPKFNIDDFELSKIQVPKLIKVNNKMDRLWRRGLTQTILFLIWNKITK